MPEFITDHWYLCTQTLPGSRMGGEALFVEGQAYQCFEGTVGFDGTENYIEHVVMNTPQRGLGWRYTILKHAWGQFFEPVGLYKYAVDWTVPYKVRKREAKKRNRRIKDEVV